MGTRYTKFVLECSARYQLNPKLIAAVIFQESGGNAFAFRFEPAYFEKHFKNRSLKQLSGHIPSQNIVSAQTELFSRACSYGLMQILGETARSILSFDGDFLTELFDPEENINLGCKYLAGLMRTEGTLEGALEKYNGSPIYPPKIIKHMDSGESDFLLI